MNNTIMSKLFCLTLVATVTLAGYCQYDFVFDGVTYSGGNNFYYSNDYFTRSMSLKPDDPFLYFCVSYEDTGISLGSGSLVRVKRSLTGEVTVLATVNRQSNGFRDVNIRWIQAGAFADCSNIESVVISEGVRGVGDEVFRNCTSLKSVSFPSTLETIGSNVFMGCPNLEEVSIPYENRNFKVEGGLLLSIDGKTVVGVQTKNPGVSIPTTITTLASGCFAGCENVEVTFEGLPPTGFEASGAEKCRMVYYQEEYADEWLEMIRQSGKEFANVTMLAQTPAGFLKRAFSAYADVAERGAVFDVTLRADVPSTVSIPDNLGDVYVDLKGHNMIGKPAIAVVASEDGGSPTRLYFSDSVPDDSVDIKGVDGVGYENKSDPSYPAIEVKTGCRDGVIVSIDENVMVLGGNWGCADIESRSAMPSPAVVGNVGYNRGRIMSGFGELGVVVAAVKGDVWMNEGQIWVQGPQIVEAVTGVVANEGGSLPSGLTEQAIAEAAGVSPWAVSCTFDGMPHSVDVPVSSTFDSSVAYSMRRDGPYGAARIEFTGVTNAVVWYVHSSPRCGPAVTNVALVSIAPKEIATAWVGQVADAVGNGSDAVTPVPVVTDPALGGLVAGRDFTVNYENNVAMGVARVTVVGIGNYSGEVSRNFNIVGLSDSSWTATLGSNKKVVIVKAGIGSTGDVVVPSAMQGYEVVEISAKAFEGRSDITSITIPQNVSVIGDGAFANCPNLKRITLNTPPLPGMATYAFGGVADILDVPANLKAQWDKYIFEIPSAVEVKSSVRATDPGVIDIEYMVKSAYSKAKTRILAFENGERVYISMLRPETFIDDTAKNIGDGIDTFVWHKVSWQATADWGIDLAKVKVEILAKDMSEGLLSFHTVTIPAMNGRPKMVVCTDGNLQTGQAIFWLYADRANGLRLEDGKIYDGNTLLAEQFGPYAYTLKDAGWSYIYGKMGYSMLSDKDAKYVSDLLRIPCYGGTPYKVVEE